MTITLATEEQRPATLPAPFWYQQPGAVEHRFYGVFEGGGAKGVAYVGALRAMKEKGCWFSGVAGASAGAITAALIAAGLDAEDMAAATDAALGSLRTKFWSGLWRLRSDTTGYFHGMGLREWLEGVLRAQLSLPPDPEGERPVTFEQLHQATRIELNIVAADLSLRQQVIFSHLETPNCGVADAVVASSSIPFAFASGLLEVPVGGVPGASYHHTIVDGGVWSNFPTFIFDDPAFRRRYKRDPVVLDQTEVLGFLLDEAGEESFERSEEVKSGIKFAPTGTKVVIAREWRSVNNGQGDPPCGLLKRAGGWGLYPFGLLGRISNGERERGRWPTSRSPVARPLVDSLNGLLGSISVPLFGLAACLVVAIGAWVVSDFLVVDTINSFRTADWTHPITYAARLLSVMFTLVLVSASVLLVFMTVLAVSANYFLLRSARRILYGLVTTYVAGSGAPAWVKERDNVIALPIPPCVSTMSFDMRPEDRRRIVGDAWQATHDKLDEILPARARPARE